MSHNIACMILNASRMNEMSHNAHCNSAIGHSPRGGQSDNGNNDASLVNPSFDNKPAYRVLRRTGLPAREGRVVGLSAEISRSGPASGPNLASARAPGMKRALEISTLEDLEENITVDCHTSSNRTNYFNVRSSNPRIVAGLS